MKRLLLTVGICLICSLLSVPIFVTTAFAHPLDKQLTLTPPKSWKPYIPTSEQGHMTVTQKGDLFIVKPDNLSSPIRASIVASPNIAASCFPDNAIWTWDDAANNLQAWIGPQETDSVSGLHNNLHVQYLSPCGQDLDNYHIKYQGVEDDNYVWEVVDTGPNATTSDPVYYEAWTGLGETDAADTAASALAGDVGAAVADDALGSALLDILPDVLIGLLLA